MAGLINSAIQPNAGPMAQPTQNAQTVGQSQAGSQASDPILSQIQDGVEAKINPALKQNHMAIIISGMKILFDSAASQKMIQELKTSSDIVKTVSEGIADTVALVFNHIAANMNPAQKKAYMQKFIPSAGTASVVLMCQVLDVAERTMGLKITPQIAAACAKATVSATLARFKIGNQQIQQAVSAGRKAKPNMMGA